MPLQQIRIEPGALDAIPLNELARFLAQHGLELVYKPDGLTVRAAVDRADEPPQPAESWVIREGDDPVRPAEGVGRRVDVNFRDGAAARNVDPETLTWEMQGHPRDIISWKWSDGDARGGPNP